MKPLAQNHIEIARSENPKEDFLYTPSILSLKNGRILASYDISCKRGLIKASDDNGKTWQLKAERDFYHARLFVDGNRVYILGHMKDLVVYYSDDNGDTWSEGSYLTSGEHWHQSACSVCYKNGYVYLVMEIAYVKPDEEPWGPYWAPNIYGITVMRGKLGSDLTKRENWLFSERVRFRDIVHSEEELEYFGVPFLRNCWKPENRIGTTTNVTEYQEKYDFEKDEEGIGLSTNPIGWLETNVVEITDPEHFWYDKTGKTLHLFSRANTTGSGYCCMMKAVERIENGKEIISVECEKTPSGKKIVFLPMPGGQMKFFVKYDEETKLYWLLSTQATDTMRKPQYLPKNRFDIPNNERDRLALHFSKNMVY